MASVSILVWYANASGEHKLSLPDDILILRFLSNISEHHYNTLRLVNRNIYKKKNHTHEFDKLAYLFA